MWNKLKDGTTAIFWVASAAALTIAIWTMGMIVLIPAIIYGAYRVLQIRREAIKEQTNEHRTIRYTKKD